MLAGDSSRRADSQCVAADFSHVSDENMGNLAGPVFANPVWRGGAALRRHRFHLSGPLALLFLAIFAVVGAADAGQNPDPSANQPSRATSDFLFGRPHGSIAARGTWVFARAGSDLFDFVQNQLTIDDGDFNAPAIGVDIGVAVTPRVEVLFGFEFSQAAIASEYRNFVDNNQLPITQQTELKEINLSGSVRIPLRPRGRGVSRFVWIPRSLTPYVGGGGGFLWYDFKQSGDFVDFVDLRVFSDFFRSSGWTPSVHALGGVDVQLYRRLFLNVEGRYLWAAGELGRDFVDFDPIDLAGLRLAVGVNILF